MVDIQSATTEIRRGKNQEEERNRTKNIVPASATQGGHNKNLMTSVSWKHIWLIFGFGAWLEKIADIYPANTDLAKPWTTWMLEWPVMQRLGHLRAKTDILTAVSAWQYIYLSCFVLFWQIFVWILYVQLIYFTTYFYSPVSRVEFGNFRRKISGNLIQSFRKFL